MRFGFWLKCLVSVTLVIVFDRLFPDSLSGARVGVFAAAWLAGLALARSDVRRAWVALVPAAVFAAVLFDDPGMLAWVMFWSALSIAALWPRVARFDSAWHWGVRLLLHAGAGLARPVRDLRAMGRVHRAEGSGSRAIAATLALPLAGGVLFLLLFAAANPLIAQALASISLPSVWQVLEWLIVGLCLWPAFRPHPAAIRLAATLSDPEPRLPGTSLHSVLMALALFNAIFAVQNGLDVAFLWSGGTVPAGISQTEYVHRGAYPLIVTALIAGVMALAMLCPGSPSERHPWARRLVVLWVVQNLVLVASSALRTIDYIEASMLTAWRIAALIWMALVALGLLLIVQRILAGRSARWLINRNALAAGLVLTVCSCLDLGAIAAAWNVDAKDPAQVDLCYLAQVGDGALLPIVELEHRPMDAATRDRVRYVRAELFARLADEQSHWTEWTPRGARRLSTARRRLGPAPAAPMPLGRGEWRGCDGTIGRQAQP